MTGAEFYAYVLRLGFKRTDKETEFFEAVTDTVEEMRRRFGFSADGTEITTTDTISVDGDFKITLETDFGIVSGVVMEDGTNAKQLNLISKDEFDAKYPDINVTASRGYPVDACIFGGNLYVGPIPDDTSYSYRITYYLKGETIVTGTVSVPFTSAYRDILADGVQFRLYKALDAYDKAGAFKDEFEAGLLKAIRRERINSGAHFFQQKAIDF